MITGGASGDAKVSTELYSLKSGKFLAVGFKNPFNSFEKEFIPKHPNLKGYRLVQTGKGSILAVGGYHPTTSTKAVGHIYMFSPLTGWHKRPESTTARRKHIVIEDY